MKQRDLTKKVMERVVAWERVRAPRWRRRYWLVVVLLMAFFSAGTRIVVSQLQEQQTWDLVLLLTQDWEIIAEFWQDSVGIFWQEAPQELILFLAVLLLAGVIFFITTRKKRKIIGRKLKQLARYNTKRALKGGSL